MKLIVRETSPTSLPSQIFGERYGSEDLRIELCPRGPYSVEWTPSWLVLGVALEPQTGVHAIGSHCRTQYAVDGGTISLTPPGCDIYSESEHGGAYLICSVAPSIYQPFLKGQEDQQPLMHERRSQCGSMELINTVKQYLAWIARSRDLPAFFHEGFGLQLLALIQEELSSGARTIRARQLTPITAQRLNQFIEENLHLDLRVATLAQYLGVSSSHLSRLFRVKLRTSPYVYIMERRLERARRLLVTSGDSIVDIALQCGFSSQSHLTSTFTGRFGMAPGSYRRRAKNSV